MTNRHLPLQPATGPLVHPGEVAFHKDACGNSAPPALHGVLVAFSGPFGGRVVSEKCVFLTLVPQGCNIFTWKHPNWPEHSWCPWEPGTSHIIHLNPKKIEIEGVQGMHEILESIPTSIYHFILYTVVKRQVSLSNMAGTSRSEGREKILKCCGSAFWPHYWFWHELTMCSSGLSPNLSWKQLKFGATWCISLQQRHRKI